MIPNIQITTQELLTLDEIIRELYDYQNKYDGDRASILGDLRDKLLTITDPENLADYQQISESSNDEE
jgi:hypothetical protein